jgi:hypothetical protein
MLVGQPPFVDDDPLKVYQQVSCYFLHNYTFERTVLLNGILYLCVYGTVFNGSVEHVLAVHKCKELHFT